MTAYEALVTHMRAALSSANALEAERVALATQTQELGADVQRLSDERATLEGRVAELAARVAELEDQVPPVVEPPVVEPPVVVDPPTVPGQPIPTPEYPFHFGGALEGPPPSWGRYSQPGALELDAPIRPWPQYSKPTEVDLVLTGAGVAQPDGRYVTPLAAYHALLRSGALDSGRPVRVGVRGKCGRVTVAGQYDASDPESFLPTADRASMPVSAAFVGLTPDAELELGFAHNVTQGVTGNVAAFDVGLRGANDAFCIRAVRPSGHILLDGCYFVAHAGFDQEGQMLHDAGIHVAHYGSLLIRRAQSRGFKCNEHWAYPKSQYEGAPDPFVIVAECDLVAGRRTGVQRRPGRGDRDDARPAGDLFFVDNVTNHHGWNLVDPDGGGVLSGWAAPESRIFFLGNEVLDARNSCITAEGQSPARNWLNDAGFPIHEVHFAGNRVSNPRSQRQAVSFGAVERLFIYGSNELLDGAEVFLGSEFNAVTSHIANGQVRLVGGPMKGERFRRWDGSSHVLLSETELAPLRV